MDVLLGNFLPHGFCFLWQPKLLWLHIVSDATIALAYFSIPTLLVVLLSRRKQTPYMGLFVMFGFFIVLCGSTHIIDIITIWHPIYWIAGFVKGATAIVSIATAAMLAPILPKLIDLPNPIADTLTALPNRLLFIDRLKTALLRIKRDEHSSLAVLFVDLDGFKNVNDSLGHNVGNQVLVRVGERLAGSIRSVDTVARFGGDEFMILLEHIDGPLYAKAVARRIISEVQRPFRIGEHNVEVGASVGIVVSYGDQTPEDLISAADTAMYRAKQKQRGTFELYDKAWSLASPSPITEAG